MTAGRRCTCNRGVRETYPRASALEMYPTTRSVQDKGSNRTEARGRLSPATLIQLGSTRIIESPNVVDLALEEQPTVGLTVDYVQIFGTRVNWEQVLKDVFVTLTERNQAANPPVSILARYGKRTAKTRDSHP